MNYNPEEQDVYDFNSMWEECLLEREELRYVDAMYAAEYEALRPHMKEGTDAWYREYEAVNALP